MYLRLLRALRYSAYFPQEELLAVTGTVHDNSLRIFLCFFFNIGVGDRVYLSQLRVFRYSAFQRNYWQLQVVYISINF